MLKVLVTGFPGTGTSVVADVLSHGGLQFGCESDLKQRDRHNPYGYFEHMGIRSLTWEPIEGVFNCFSLTQLNEVQSAYRRVGIKVDRIKELLEEQDIQCYKDNALPFFFERFGFQATVVIHCVREENSVWCSSMKSWRNKPKATFEEFTAAYSKYNQICDRVFDRKQIKLSYDQLIAQPDYTIDLLQSELRLKNICFSSARARKAIKSRQQVFLKRLTNWFYR